MMYIPISGTFKSNSDTLELSSDLLIRPYKLFTSVEREAEETLTGLEVNGVNELVSEIDAYIFAASRVERLREEFLKQYNIESLNDDELDFYLDTHDLSIPEVGRIWVGTVKPGEPIIVRRKPTEYRLGITIIASVGR